MRAAFRAEVAYYVPQGARRARRRRASAGLARRCAGVFLEHLGAPTSTGGRVRAGLRGRARVSRRSDGADQRRSSASRRGPRARVRLQLGRLARRPARACRPSAGSSPPSSPPPRRGPEAGPGVFRLALERLGTRPGADAARRRRRGRPGRARRRPGSSSSRRRSLPFRSGSGCRHERASAPARTFDHARHPHLRPRRQARESRSSSRSSPRRRSRSRPRPRSAGSWTEEEYGFVYSRLRNPTVEELNARPRRPRRGRGGPGIRIRHGRDRRRAAHEPRPGRHASRRRSSSTAPPTSCVESQLRPHGVEVVYLDAADAAAWERPARVRLRRDDGEPRLPRRRPRCDRGDEGRRPARSSTTRSPPRRSADRSSTAPTSSASRPRST